VTGDDPIFLSLDEILEIDAEQASWQWCRAARPKLS